MQDVSGTPRVALLTIGVCAGRVLALFAAAQALGLG